MDILLIITTIIFLVAIAWNDFKSYEIPDYLSLGGFASIAVLQIVTGGNLKSAIMGAIVGAALFWLQYIIFGENYLGFGDVLVGGLIGLILGWPQVLFAITTTYVLGAIISLVLVAFKIKKINSPFPLGGFLSLVTVGMLLWNNYFQ